MCFGPGKYPPHTILSRNLPTGSLGTLHHGGILFLEALIQSRGALEVLVDTAQDTALFTVDERLGGEVIDTVIEASLDHLGVHL